VTTDQGFPESDQGVNIKVPCKDTDCDKVMTNKDSYYFVLKQDYHL